MVLTFFYLNQSDHTLPGYVQFILFQKALMSQVKDCNKDLEHYAEYKKMAQEKERTLKSLNQDKDELGEQLNEMEEELKPLKEKQKEIDQIASGFSDIQNKYTEGMQDFFFDFLQIVHHFTDLKNVSF